MSPDAAHDRRASPRVEIALEVHLARKVGSAVTSRTLDLSTGGARVLSKRPLRVDEELQFDFDLPAGRHLHGTARVLRQDRHDLYALRFEQVPADAAQALAAFVQAG